MQPLASCIAYDNYKNYISNSKEEAIEILLKKEKSLISQLCETKAKKMSLIKLQKIFKDTFLVTENNRKRHLQYLTLCNDFTSISKYSKSINTFYDQKRFTENEVNLDRHMKKIN